MQNRRNVILSLVLIGVSLPSCGRNKFEQEVDKEKGAVTLARETASGGYGLMTTEELQAKVAAGKNDFVLLDAMPAGAYAKEHIPGAKNFAFPIPVLEPKEGKLAWPAKDVGGTRQELEKLLGPDKTKEVVVYCGYVKCTRSHNAALWAMQLGYRNVLRHPGGIYAWKGAKHAVESGAK